MVSAERDVLQLEKVATFITLWREERRHCGHCQPVEQTLGWEGEGDLSRGPYLGLLGFLGPNADLHPPNADLKDAAGGRVKVHGEPAGGSNLGVEGPSIRGWVSPRHRTVWGSPRSGEQDRKEEGPSTFCIAAQRTSLPLW